MSHTELISFLRSLPDTGVILIFYRDASRAQTPISTPTGDAVDLSRSHPNLTFLKSNSSFGKTNKPLRFEAKEMVRSLQVRALNIFTFFLKLSYAPGPSLEVVSKKNIKSPNKFALKTGIEYLNEIRLSEGEAMS